MKDFISKLRAIRLGRLTGRIETDGMVRFLPASEADEIVRLLGKAEARSGVKVLVCGRERFTDRDFIHGALARLDDERGPFTTVMQFGDGSGAGPDSQVRDWVWENEVSRSGHPRKLRTYSHCWDIFGPGAHHKTYDEILENDAPDLVIVFGPEQGSHRPFVRRAREAGIEIIEFPFEARHWSAGRRYLERAR
jgi:hypothetical protein